MRNLTKGLQGMAAQVSDNWLGICPERVAVTGFYRAQFPAVFWDVGVRARERALAG